MLTAVVILHFGYKQLYREYATYLRKLSNKPFITHILISTADEIMPGSDLVKSFFKKIPKVTLLTYPNRGMDIGPFLHTVKYMIDNNIFSDIILKLHSKKLKKWRMDLITPLTKNVDSTMQQFDDYPKVGVVGTKRWLFQLDHLNVDTVTQLSKEWNMSTTFYDEVDLSIKAPFDWKFYITHNAHLLNFVGRAFPDYKHLIEIDDPKFKRQVDIHYAKSKDNKLLIHPSQLIKPRQETVHYIAGSIFAIRTHMLLDFIKKVDLNLPKMVARMETGYFTDKDKGTITHAWERILSGLIPHWMGYQTVGV